MRHIPRTPESLLPRSDSKNPATTCRGLTTSGRPCRRAVASPTKSSFSIPTNAGGGRALADDVPPLFCWQHKDQAPLSFREPGSGTPAGRLHGRKSFDSVLEQLGALSIADDASVRSKRRARHLPVSEPNTVPVQEKAFESKSREKNSRGLLKGLLCCCWGALEEDEERIEIVRHRKRVGEGKVTFEDRAPPSVSRSRQTPADLPAARTRRRQVHGAVDMEASRKSVSSALPKCQQQLNTATLRSSVQAQLLAETSKPISSADEDGYIYIYWLTDSAKTSPKSLSSFFEKQQYIDTQLPCTRKTRAGTERTSPPPSPNASHGKLLIKIGRATNVHRRLASWTQQCGYNLSLIRYYPHMPTLLSPPTRNPDVMPSTASPPADDAIRKVPYSHRVERLIHIELSEQRVRHERCKVCGAVHREWFEVDASREGFRAVDEIVTRWVSWAERLRDQEGV